jgi:hypothetical protein
MSFENLPPRPRKLWHLLPLVAAGALLAWLWRGAPHTVTVHLRLGPDASTLSEVELDCHDDQRLAGGVKWSLATATSAELRHEFSFRGVHLECEVSLAATSDHLTVLRQVTADSDELWLDVGRDVTTLARAQPR